MNKTNLKALMAIAAGTALTLPAPAGMGAQIQNPAQRMQNAAANNATFSLRAQNPKINDDGTASIVIDLSGLNPFDYMKLLASDRTLVVFREPQGDPEKLCPYFGLAARQYEVRQIHPEKSIYRIKAHISKDEEANIAKAGCIITDTISPREIKPYRPEVA